MHSRLATFLTILAFAIPGAALRAQDVPEASPRAIHEFAEGMKYYAAGDYEHSVDHFLRAQELDPRFAVAQFFAGLALTNASEFERADSLMALAEQAADRLSPYYRGRIATQRAGLRADMAETLEMARRTAEGAPGTKAVYNYALYSSRLNRPRQALSALEQLDPSTEPMASWDSYWSVLWNLQHRLGMHEEELGTILRARPYLESELYGSQAIALAALGRTEEVKATLDAAAESAPGGGWNAPGLVAAVAAELRAHGHEAAAAEMRQRLLAWYEEGPAQRRASANNRSWYAFTLAHDGRFGESARIFRELVEEAPENQFYRAYGAYAALNAGDSATLEDADRWLATLDTPADRGSSLYWRGELAAARGDGAEAARYIDMAMNRGQAYGMWWHRDPVLLALRDDPAMREIFSPTR